MNNLRCGPRYLSIWIFLTFIGFHASRAQVPAPAPWQTSISRPGHFELDLSSLQQILHRSSSRWEKETGPSTLLHLPLPDGTEATFALWRSEQMAPELAARYPRIQTFYGRRLQDDRQSIYILLQSGSAKVLFFNEKGMTGRLEPLSSPLPLYQFSRPEDWAPPFGTALSCTTSMIEDEAARREYRPGEARRGETQLFRYRLALACSGEYGQYHGSTKEEVLAAMNELLLQVNAVFERQSSIHFDLVANNDTLIFLDPATDPFVSHEINDLLETNKLLCNQNIGFANFDLGHVLTTKFGGQAQIGTLCNDSQKAKAFSGLQTPEGYYLGMIFAHELAHQLGAQHTQSNDCNRNAKTAFEPGSGSTIMAYAGICAPNVQALPHDYFHGNSLELLIRKTALGAVIGCSPGEITDNYPPEVDAGPDLVVPAGTPFLLKGSATDLNGDSLTYLWEQMDAWTFSDTANLAGPIFRSIPPGPDPVRHIGASGDPWEMLPLHSRQATFRLTVRDQHNGLGSTAYDEMTVYFIDSLGAFTVITPNDSSENWNAGSQQLVIWDDGNDDAVPQWCDTVDILLSADGGQNYNIILAEGVINDGSELIQVPELSGDRFRIMVACHDGHIFDISDQPFEIVNNVPSYPGDTVISGADTTIFVSFLDTLVIPDPIIEDHLETDGNDADLIGKSERQPNAPLPAGNIDALEKGPFISLAPNPSRGAFRIRIHATEPDSGWYNFLNSSGQALHKKHFSWGSGVQDLQIEVPDFGQGVYWVRLVTDEFQWVGPIVLVR